MFPISLLFNEFWRTLLYTKGDKLVTWYCLQNQQIVFSSVYVHLPSFWWCIWYVNFLFSMQNFNNYYQKLSFINIYGTNLNYLRFPTILNSHFSRYFSRLHNSIEYFFRYDSVVTARFSSQRFNMLQKYNEKLYIFIISWQLGIYNMYYKCHCCIYL